MPTSVSIGFSQAPDPQKAILQACVHVKNQLDTAATDLIIIFASPEYAIPEVQAVIARTLNPRHLVGSSTGGIILSNGVTNQGVAIVGINSSDLHFGSSATTTLNVDDMHYAGFDLARKAIQNLKTTHRGTFITFSQGIEENCSRFIRGVKETLGSGFPMLGAVSSDDLKYQKLSQFFQNQILHNSVVGLLITGAVPPSLACTNGFKPLGKPRTITKSDNCIIRTIDNEPAVELYKHFLGSEAQDLINAPLTSWAAMYPLGIYLEEPQQYLLRNIIDILKDGSIVCHGGIPEGARVHLMMSTNKSCHNAAVKAAELVKASLAGRQAKLILVFDSLARHKILGSDAFGEIQAIKNVLGSTTPIIGMCSYGEIGPFGTLDNIKNTYLHNSSIVMVAIS